MSIRVLIVEDNTVASAFLLRVVRESFNDELEFTEVRNLESARRALRSAAASNAAPAEATSGGAAGFQIILCDLEQPDGSGLELLAELSEHRALKIATTLHLDDDHLFPALQCGASGYLLKEDRFEVLVEGLQRIARGHPPMSPAIARRILSFFRGASGGRPSSFESGFASLSEFGGSTRPAPLGDGSAPVQGLTTKEAEVLVHLSKGFTLKEIARLMGLKGFAINDHIRSIYVKLAGHSSPMEALALSRQALE